MRFRKRNSRFRFARPRGPRPFWAAAVFNESTLNLAGDLSELVVLDDSDWADPDLATSRQFGMVERVIITGSMTWQPQATTPATDIGGWATAVYKVDVDDIALDTLWSSSSAGSLLKHADRVLFTKYRQLTIQETNSSAATASSPNQVEVDIDLKVKVKVDLDTILCLGLQFGGSMTAAVAGASFSGLARVLVRKLT